jgi:hypothetical protein
VFNTIFFENPVVYEKKVEKCCRAGQAIDETIAHAHVILDT